MVDHGTARTIAGALLYVESSNGMQPGSSPRAVRRAVMPDTLTIHTDRDVRLVGYYMRECFLRVMKRLRTPASGAENRVAKPFISTSACGLAGESGQVI